MSYQFYTQDLRSLLSDEAGAFYSQNQLTRWINQARTNLAKRTGCIQCFVSGVSSLGSSAQPGYIIPNAMIPGSLPNAIPATNNALATFSQSANNIQTIPQVERYPFQGFWNPII